MSSPVDGSVGATPPSGSGYHLPIKLLGGVLWSLVGVSFVVLWRVGDFVDAPQHVLANADILGQVIAVLAVFFLAVPVVLTFYRGKKDSTTRDKQRIPSEQSGSDNSSDVAHDAGQDSLDLFS